MAPFAYKSIAYSIIHYFYSSFAHKNYCLHALLRTNIKRLSKKIIYIFEAKNLCFKVKNLFQNKEFCVFKIENNTIGNQFVGNHVGKLDFRP